MNGKLSGFATVRLDGASKIAALKDSPYVKPGASTYVLNDVEISGNSTVEATGDVTVKALTMNSAELSAKNLTATDVTFSGDERNTIDTTGPAGGGTVNIKKIVMAGNAAIKAREAANLTSRVTVNAIEYADGYEDARIVLWVMYATTGGEVWVHFHNGQTVVNCPATVAITAFSLKSGDDIDDIHYGHTLGTEGTDWHFERGPGNKNIIFRSGMN